MLKIKGKELDDKRIQHYILHGYYGDKKLRKELETCKGYYFNAALRGEYGSQTQKVAENLVKAGVREPSKAKKTGRRKLMLESTDVRELLDMF